MELKIEPEAVNKLVAEAVLNSAIGEAVKKSVEKELSNLTKSWDNPLEGVIRNHVTDMIREILVNEYQETLRAKITEALATKLSNDFIDAVCEKAASRYT